MEDSETGKRKTSLEKVSLNQLQPCNNSLYIVVYLDSGVLNLDLYHVPYQFWGLIFLYFTVLKAFSFFLNLHDVFQAL